MLVICLNDLLLRDSFTVARGKQHTENSTRESNVEDDDAERQGREDFWYLRVSIKIWSVSMPSLKAEQNETLTAKQRYEHEQFCYIIIKL